MLFARSTGPLTIPFIVGLSLCPAASALAEEESILDLSLGGGVGYEPDYEGSDDYEVSPIPYIELSLLGGLASLSPGGLEAALPLNDNFFIGLGLGYDGGRDEDENAALDGLGDVDGSLVGSIGGALALDPAVLSLIFTHDLGSGHEGYTIDLETEYGIEVIEDKVEIGLGAGITWASQNYTEAYFGVSTAQAAASGLNQFDVDAGFKSAGVGVSAGYALTDYAALQLELGYRRLLGDVADSPIVDNQGSPNQFSAGLILALTFGVF